MIPPPLFYHSLLKKAKQSITWIKIVIGSLIKNIQIVEKRNIDHMVNIFLLAN